MNTQKAHDVLTAHWDGSIPVDVLLLAKKVGLNVSFVSNLKDIAQLNSANLQLHVRDEELSQRKRFVIAHALVKLLSQTTELSSQTIALGVKDFNYDTTENKLINKVVTQILVPSQILSFVVLEKNINDPLELSKIFDVSSVLMSQRIQEVFQLNHKKSFR